MQNQAQYPRPKEGCSNYCTKEDIAGKAKEDYESECQLVRVKPLMMLMTM